jgi:RNA recognition motif-containing protein
MKLYVGNLAYSVTDGDLKEVFGKFGDTGQSKGFGFVEMPDNSAADAAIKALNETDLKGRSIKVNQARPKSDRPAPRRGGGGGRY